MPENVRIAKHKDRPVVIDPKTLGWRSAVASKYGPGSPTTRHVLLTLSLHMSEMETHAFPSVIALAEETGLSDQQVASALYQAIHEGWLSQDADGYMHATHPA